MILTRTLCDLDSLLARLPTDADLAVVRDGRDTLIGLSPTTGVCASGDAALSALDDVREGWWAGFLNYDLGRAVERVPELTAPTTIPDISLARFDTRLRWAPSGEVSIEGDGAQRATLETLLESAAPSPVRTASLREWGSSLDRSAWGDRVMRILAHLRAGDCYQVNLTRRLSSPERADAVSLFRSLLIHNPAPHAALIRLGDIAVVSASPERFLRREGRAVETRPIKGTSTDPDVLVASAKDRAENVMIVDLARNDLGRVCDYDTVHVTGLCEVEAHPGLFHLVSTIRGTLREGTTNGDLIRATFPPASVTGCPKPRVLEIIESLEPVRRGVYCGAVGFIDTGASVVDLNVAIRTFTITPDGTSLGVGGGIVAESDPGAEWDETELKAKRLLDAALV